MVTYEGSRIKASSLSDVKNIKISTCMFCKKSATISTFQYNSAENFFPFSPSKHNWPVGEWEAIGVSLHNYKGIFFFFSQLLPWIQDNNMILLIFAIGIKRRAISINYICTGLKGWSFSSDKLINKLFRFRHCCWPGFSISPLGFPRMFPRHSRRGRI